MGLGNPVKGPRIVPFMQARGPKDVLPNGRPGFRVTQRFNDWDAFFKNRIHGAMDIANFHCGDEVVAMNPGVVLHIADSFGALGVAVQHDDHTQEEHWHLSVRLVQAGLRVKRGQLIGRVGNTGIDIDGCHLHVRYLNANGVPVDPWPLLDQNIPPTSEDIVVFNNGVDGVNLRDAPNATTGKILATAYKDPKGIIWKAGSATTKPRKGQKVGNTSSQRKRIRVVIGTDSKPYNHLRIAGTNDDEYVQSQFMHKKV